MVRLNLQLFAKSITELAKEVIQGKYGNGQARKDALGDRYAEVQAEVNRLMNGGSSTKTTTTTATPTTKITTPTTSNATKTTSAATNTTKTTTTNNNSNTLNLLGVDQSLVDRANSKPVFSEKVTENEQLKNNAASDYKDHISTNIIDPSIYEGLQAQWNGGSEVIKQADEFINSQLQWLQGGGKTQWSDKYSAAIDEYLNREKFEYDVDKDTLFQQALSSAMNSGRSAMQDTIGQASALTGGYGSTYATSAGNQAYNAFIEDAYNNLPQYYQMALEAYQAEGQDLYNKVTMLGQADETEYGKKIDALNATSDRRNQRYNEEYSTFRDSKTDLYNIGNLQATEWSNKADALYNSYNIYSSEYESAYKKDWDAWQQDVNTALELIGITNTDAWKQKEFDQTETWNQKEFDYKVERDGIEDSQWQKTFDATYESDGNGGYISRSLAEDIRQFDKTFDATYESDGNGGYQPKGANTGGNNGKAYSLTNTEIGELKKVYEENGGGEAGLAAVDERLTLIGKNNLGDESKEALKSTLENANVPLYYQDWTIADDTYNGGWFFGTNWLGGGDDHNDTFTNADGTITKTFDELKEAIENSSLSDEEKKRRIDALRNQSKN